ncbi:MAG: lyase family protein, partial [Candidatus Bathyarchaeia archaeon]
VGKVMGSVGTGAGLGDNALKIQELALKRLGLRPADMVNQVIQRDVHAELLSILGNIANTLDKIGTEIRNLQRTEIGELMEPFREDTQVGSSAMPAKRNPVKSENVCSLARLVRSLVFTGFENVPLWHERDLTNSANERFTIPFSFLLVDDMLRSIIRVLEGIVVFEENMRRNLDLTGGLILAEKVSIELVKKGLGRQEAHEAVRTSAMRAYRERVGFKEALLANPEIASRLTEKDLDSILDYRNYLGVSKLLIDDSIKRSEKELAALSRRRLI